MTKHYIVWKVGGRPEDGTRIAATSSFEARQICAAAWKVAVTEIMARATQ